MQNPLSPSIGPGYFSQMSLNNKESDLKKIVDKKSKLNTGLKPFELPLKALVINLPTREDRWLEFKRRNESLFQEFEVERVDGIIEKKPHDGIFNSHLNCMRIAKESGRAILVLEDDCELAKGWFEKLQEVFLNLPADWDVLIGNHYFFVEIEILTDHLAKPKPQASTANFVIYNTTCFDLVTENMSKRDDLNLMDIDHFLTSIKTPINNYTIWPMLSREFVTFSDHHGRIRNMEYRVRENSYQFQYIDSDIYYPTIESW